jgi:lactoylglutathione lyase
MVLSVMPNLFTADVERAVALYRDLLGGTETFRYPDRGPMQHVELRFGDVTLALSHRDALEEEALGAPTAGHPVELVMWCESVDDTVDALRGAGTPILVEPYSGHVSGHRRAYAADPDGNWLALVSREGTAPG